MKVEFLNLKKAYLEVKSELDQLWQEINEDSIYITGQRLKNFEADFANYVSAKHVIGVGNGLDALTLSLKALDIKEGDEVIVPSHTFIASWLSISACKAIPIPAEINDEYLIDPLKIENLITSKTKAIMPVHLYGNVCDMNAILNIANKYNLKVIEDAAQAHGAKCFGTSKTVGSIGHVTTFSFYPGKNLGCFGDGGCISTNDDDIAHQIMLLRNYGSIKKYEHELQGTNSRLDELQAGILSIKLKKLNEWNLRRKEIAKLYISELSNIDGLVLPKYTEGHVWHIFNVRVNNRDKFIKYLEENSIEAHIHYPTPVHLQKAYSSMKFDNSNLLFTEEISKQILSLPIGPHMDKSEVNYCIEKIKKFFNY